MVSISAPTTTRTRLRCAGSEAGVPATALIHPLYLTKVTRLEHSLQSATRAHRAGKDSEYIAAALLHDIGDALAPISHGELVGAVLRPFVSERVCWIVQKHA